MVANLHYQLSCQYSITLLWRIWILILGCEGLKYKYEIIDLLSQTTISCH